jgi:signal transduction histidine kinase
VIGRGSLAFRLFAGAATVAVLLLLVGALALTTLYRQSVLGTLDDRLTGTVSALLAAADTDEDGAIELARRPSDPAFGRVFSGRYWQIIDIDETGNDDVLMVSRSLWDETLYLPQTVIDAVIADPATHQVLSGKGPESEPLRFVVQGVLLPGRDSLIIAVAGEDRRPADTDVLNFGITSGTMFLVFAAVIAAGVYFQVRVGLAPVLRMRDGVVDIREGRVEHVEGEFPTELQPLADELNAMLDHSRELVERSRTHVGNLAHALKTPLAVLTNEAREDDSTLSKLVARQSDIMAKQVDHHLRRARAAAHAKAVGARTEVEPLVGDLARTLMRINQRRGINIETETEAGLFFRGERQDLEEMIGNLMDNACKWSGGEVRVTARSAEDKTLNIVIEDDGPGLDADGCTKALERGVRLDEQAPGTGLGLAIVADLAKAYDGDIELSRSDMAGLLVKLSLPAVSR